MKELSSSSGRVLLVVMTAGLFGCRTDHLYHGQNIYRDGIVYRGGAQVMPRELAINDHYAFTLVDKWRISHAWLSGPPDIDYCRYSRRDSDLGIDRFFELGGALKVESFSGAAERYGKKYVSNPQNRIYGTDPRTGKFTGYSPFCNHAFADIWSGVSISLIRPNPANGTNAWVLGAQRVSMHGLTWLKQSAPVKDDDEATRQRSSLVERWVLEIPETPYWLMIVLGGSRSIDGKGPGMDRDPEKFARVLNLVHQIVESVRVEPIEVAPATLPLPESKRPA